MVANSVNWIVDENATRRLESSKRRYVVVWATCHGLKVLF
ncbi:MAG: hypothetical protein JWL61_2326 [Gemmatimonadetes bacterium]|nr:hypothetical protein [Gemmatimonadota bacterium]